MRNALIHEAHEDTNDISQSESMGFTRVLPLFRG